MWSGADMPGQAGLVVQRDITPGDWISPLLVPGSFEVRMTVPQGFDAYARIFFPFDEDGTSWADSARRNKRTAHALMERETIAAGEQGATSAWSDRLSREQFDALLPILSRYTSAASGWFVAWNDLGDLTAGAPQVELPMARGGYLLHGPLQSYAALPDPPTYWWPEDRAWCVSSDVDFEWCYLAGSTACVNEVLAAAVIDAYPTSPANPARSGMDVINDPDGIVPRSM